MSTGHISFTECGAIATIPTISCRGYARVPQTVGRWRTTIYCWKKYAGNLEFWLSLNRISAISIVSRSLRPSSGGLSFIEPYSLHIVLKMWYYACQFDISLSLKSIRNQSIDILEYIWYVIQLILLFIFSNSVNSCWRLFTEYQATIIWRNMFHKFFLWCLNCWK